MSADYDLVVIGGGPGGYATALRAVRHGLRVAIVEAGDVGGTCLHRGCIPSKALLHVAALADHVPEMTELGLVSTPGELDLAAAGRFRDRVVSQLHGGLKGLLKAQQIEVIVGWGRIGEPGVVVVGDDERRLTTRNIVVATGSSPVDLPGLAPDGERILRSDDALALRRVPRRGVVVGAGAVGVEFASIWRSLGAEVVLIEAASRIVPLEDADSSAALARAFTRRGIDVRTATSLARAVITGDGVSLELDDGSAIACDQVLVAVGRRPATAKVGLDELGLLDGRGFVVVDELGRTATPGIWAIGDAVATLALAHAAFAEGFVVADAIAGKDVQPLDHTAIPRVTYSSPEVASVGLTEDEARSRHGDVTVTSSGFTGNARAMIEGQNGHVKIITTSEGDIVGAHIVGPSATELIGELGLAVSWQARADELADIVHAHPTLSENVREAALAAAGLPFHVH